MKIEKLKKRLKGDRPSKSISLKIPADVLEDLKRLAPRRGCSTPEALARAYIGQGLRADLERFEDGPLAALVEGLKKRGISKKVIDAALEDASGGVPPHA